MHTKQAKQIGACDGYDEEKKIAINMIHVSSVTYFMSNVSSCTIFHFKSRKIDSTPFPGQIFIIPKPELRLF